MEESVQVIATAGAVILLPLILCWWALLPSPTAGLSSSKAKSSASGCAERCGGGGSTLYIPKRFTVDDVAVAQRYIHDNSFAELITVNPETGLPFISHIPLLFVPPKGQAPFTNAKPIFYGDKKSEAKSTAAAAAAAAASSAAGYGTLTGHMARANPQWRQFEKCGGTVLAVFNGPHSYVSPNQYSRTTLQVPTWNYTTVHATGTVRILGETETESTMKALISRFESSRDEPWAGYEEKTFADVRHMLSGVVAFEIKITNLEGKMKLSQQREKVDWLALYSAFSSDSATPDQRALAEEMKSKCPLKFK